MFLKVTYCSLKKNSEKAPMISLSYLKERFNKLAEVFTK